MIGNQAGSAWRLYAVFQIEGGLFAPKTISAVIRIVIGSILRSKKALRFKSITEGLTGV
jgi:hypothetical protein